MSKITVALIMTDHDKPEASLVAYICEEDELPESCANNECGEKFIRSFEIAIDYPEEYEAIMGLNPICGNHIDGLLSDLILAGFKEGLKQITKP
jgi:hypothetical protein